MKLLHILKSEPDNRTRTLMDILSQGEEPSIFSFYENDPDYEKLIDGAKLLDEILNDLRSTKPSVTQV